MFAPCGYFACPYSQVPSIFQKFESYFGPFVGFLIVASVLLIVASIINWILFAMVMRRRKALVARLEAVADDEMSITLGRGIPFLLSSLPVLVCWLLVAPFASGWLFGVPTMQ